MGIIKMNKAPNMLSALGRISYTGHLLLYPLIGGGSYFLYGTYKKATEETPEEHDAKLPQAKEVDPDLFQPFSAIPYHNNLENHYRYADVKMHRFVGKTHTNVNTDPFRNFHDSYDHGNKKQHLYNWVSYVPSHNK